MAPHWWHQYGSITTALLSAALLLPRNQFAAACVLQNLLSGNVTRVSTLRYGDAKTLPEIDVHLRDGLDSVPKKLMQGLNITYNTGTACH